MILVSEGGLVVELRNKVQIKRVSIDERGGGFGFRRHKDGLFAFETQMFSRQVLIITYRTARKDDILF